MKNPIAPVFRWLTTPVAIGIAGTAGIVIGMLFLGGLHTAMEATTSTEFCISCHELRDTVYVEYQQSPHYSNASGVQASCADCHVPEPLVPSLVDHYQALGELYSSWKGIIDTPEKFEAHRLEMAERVWTYMEKTDSRECRSCHQQHAMNVELQSADAAKRMQEGFANGDTCIDCHKGIAHKMPDMSSGFREKFAALQASPAIEANEGDVLFALGLDGIWSGNEKAQAHEKEDGRILPGTRVTVLERDGDLAKVRMEGWQREGAERLIVARQGERIIEAAVNAEFAQTAQFGETMVDTDTGQTWKEVTFEAWGALANLVSDEAALWAYGEQMYKAACGGCHSLTPLGHFTATQWIGIVDGMKNNTSPDAAEVYFLKSYLQYNVPDGEEHS
ncbi:NapC/NirT family cytochrome c [Aliiruegeria lutimaris]|uniref:Cytochrome c-type protein n=1 Tax=Aliiruegeria lutimaris TaxID=571298 RepID=A0A1G8S1N0_9RHOB|nr:NapC/NirT family cytochrome c [Aliiruegeria lutimaris]SDJ23129.1 trimethylamine-N-oxide reductase (cytochrome c), cytochrome c-type subunit TorC [Aliiruegeria lutimaris]